MLGVLQKIPKIHPQLIPPQGAVQRGTTPDGKQLWYQEIPMSRSVPDIIPGTETPDNPKGEQRYKMNLAGEKVYPLFKAERYIWKRLYFLESEGNGQVNMVPYVPLTKEQIAAEERRKKIVAMKDSMAEAFVDAGVLPDNLLATLRAAQTQVPVKVDEPEIVEPVAARHPDAPTAEVETVAEPVKAPPEKPAIHYPTTSGGGWWVLSDGSKVQGKKAKAVKAEKALQKAVQEARAVAEATPDY